MLLDAYSSKMHLNSCIIDNNRKREAEVLSDGTAKKVKLASTVKDSSKMLEIVSPRRSSRILVPNRRYKDMEDLTTSKSRKSGL